MKGFREGEMIPPQQLAEVAKAAREKAGATRAEAARGLKVSWASIYQAEESPKRALFRLRSRIIQRYTGLIPEGPFYRLSKKRVNKRSR